MSRSVTNADDIALDHVFALRAMTVGLTGGERIGKSQVPRHFPRISRTAAGRLRSEIADDVLLEVQQLKLPTDMRGPEMRIIAQTLYATIKKNGRPKRPEKLESRQATRDLELYSQQVCHAPQLAQLLAHSTQDMAWASPSGNAQLLKLSQINFRMFLMKWVFAQSCHCDRLRILRVLIEGIHRWDFARQASGVCGH
jgi:hypothetical protein